MANFYIIRSMRKICNLLFYQTKNYSISMERARENMQKLTMNNKWKIKMLLRISLKS